MRDASDEELLTDIAAGPGALTAFSVRHVAKVTGMGVRRFDNGEDVADFVASLSSRRSLRRGVSIRIAGVR